MLTIRVCRPCHNQIHAVCSDKELAEERSTRDTLLAHPEIRRFVDWIRKRPSGYKPHSRAMRYRPIRGR